MQTLQQDAADKIKVTIDDDMLSIELRVFFKWRKDCNYERFSKLGTVDYDKFIAYLKRKGY